MKLDQTFLDGVTGAIVSVWGDVASDASVSGRNRNAEAIEIVLDADRLTTFGHEEADKLVEAAIDSNGYDKVLKYLAKNIRLA